MRATTKQILLELQKLGRGEPLRLSLSPSVYAFGALEELRNSLGESSEVDPLDKGTWTVPAERCGEALHTLLILTVRGLS